MEICWIPKKRAAVTDVYFDVRLSIRKVRTNEAVVISFLDGCAKSLSAKYICIGLAGEKVCFQGAKDSLVGYTLQGDPHNSCHFVCANKQLVDFAKKHKALFKLRMASDQRGVYYIDGEEGNDDGE